MDVKKVLKRQHVVPKATDEALPPTPPQYVDKVSPTDEQTETTDIQSVAPSEGMSQQSTTASFRRGTPSGMDQCDLCQAEMFEEELEDHVNIQHGALLEYVATTLSAIQELKENPKPLPSATLNAFGKYIQEDVLPSDKGEAVFKRALAAHDQVSRLVLRRFPKCKVFMFGSSVAMGSWDGAGDIDLTLVDPEGWDNGKWPTGDEGSLITRLAGICREGGFAHGDLEPLRRVRVPVLKHKRPFKLDLSEHTGYYEIIIRFEVKHLTQQETDLMSTYFATSEGGHWRDPLRYVARFKTGLDAFDAYMGRHTKLPRHTIFWASFATAPEMFGIDFDLSARAHGIRNSWLLRKYMEQSSLVRAGSVFLKHWSKASAVNNSMKGYFTSYATNILWVYFLLRRQLVTFIDPQTDVEGLASKSPIAPTYIPIINPEDRDAETFLETVAKTVFDFFCFYSYEFDWESEVVSICRVESTSKESLGWVDSKEVKTGSFRDRVWYRLCIEDPFEENLNLGRHASTPKSLKIRSQFFRAALLIVKGDFKAILTDNCVNAALERLQRQFVRQMVHFNNHATLDTIIDAINKVDPDILPSVETEYRRSQIPTLCNCVLEEDGTLSPKSATSLVGTNCIDLIEKTDADIKAAAASGLPVTELHDTHNLHPLYFSSPISKRLFLTSKLMRRFDAHFSEIKQLVPGTKEDILMRLKERVPNVDVATVNVILNDSRFIAFDGRTKSYNLTRAANEVMKNAKEEMDIASKQIGNCDECHRRDAVYSSTLGGKHKYCEPCWRAYLHHQK